MLVQCSGLSEASGAPVGWINQGRLLEAGDMLGYQTGFRIRGKHVT